MLFSDSYWQCIVSTKLFSGLTVLVPIPAGKKVTRVTCNDSSLPFSLTKVKGLRYASFSAGTGTYAVSYDLEGDTAAETIHSLWSDATVPETADTGSDNPVELGVRFSTEKAGYITGIRFYKSRNNTGIHVGALWSESGKLLAAATFDDETESGWQKTNFPAPIAVTADTPYIGSYHTNVGHYSDTLNFFAVQGFDNPPLHAPAGANGVYAYGPAGSFPNQSWNSSNYWVDVMFTETPSLRTSARTESPEKLMLNAATRKNELNRLQSYVRTANPERSLKVIKKTRDRGRNKEDGGRACDQCHNNESWRALNKGRKVFKSQYDGRRPGRLQSSR